MSDIAVITVSAQEWNETKDMIRSISERLKKIVDPNEIDLLTPKEVCEILRCGRSTFEQLKGRGILPVQRTEGSNKIYVKRSDLDKAIISNQI